MCNTSTIVSLFARGTDEAMVGGSEVNEGAQVPQRKSASIVTTEAPNIVTFVPGVEASQQIAQEYLTTK